MGYILGFPSLLFSDAATKFLRVRTVSEICHTVPSTHIMYSPQFLDRIYTGINLAKFYKIRLLTCIQYALTFFPVRVCLVLPRAQCNYITLSQNLFTGRLFDLGYFRLPMFIFSVTLVASTFLTAECTQYWQFVLCQGVALGASKKNF
jgi:hypothetical protein